MVVVAVVGHDRALVLLVREEQVVAVTGPTPQRVLQERRTGVEVAEEAALIAVLLAVQEVVVSLVGVREAQVVVETQQQVLMV